MAIVYTKTDQGLTVATGTGAPVHTAVAGDRYTDTANGNTYQYTTNWQIISYGASASLRNVTTTDTFNTSYETINCTANTFTVNLPTAVGVQGITYTLVNSGTGVITLNANGTETINGSLTIDLSIQYISRTVQSDGANWIII